jgi:hypothetical protein
MFEAMLLLCVAMDSSDCKVIKDTRGPYETIGQCNDRAAEMTAKILSAPEFFSRYTVNGARCDKVEGVKTKTSIFSDLEV